MAEQNREEMLVYVGTYTGKEDRGEGIYVYRMHPASGALEFASSVSDIVNPSFLAIHPQKRRLYAVNEVDDFEDSAGGAVSAFSIDPKTGGLTYLNRQSSQGAGPCHLSVDATGKAVLVANYSGGSVAALPIRDDGGLGEATAFIQHRGSSVNPGRQSGPHAHSITIDPTNRYAFAADLGIDKILIYRLDADRAAITPNDEPWTQVHAGAGPRHFAFHPNGKYAYLINELDNTTVAYTYDDAAGTLREVQTITTLPEDFSDTSYCADIHVSPSGKFVYGTNRGHDSIVIFRIDGGTGQLTCVGYESTQGEFPRNFAIDPTGTFLFAANQNTDNIVAFRIDQQTGALTPTGHVTHVRAPVCVKII